MEAKAGRLDDTGSALERAAVEELRGSVSELIAPDDIGYEQARRVWNGMIDKHPALIVPCRGVADVVASVRFAHTHQLPLAVRGGGHNVAGFGTCERGLVIDLSPMRGVRVDPAARTAHAGGGQHGQISIATLSSSGSPRPVGSCRAPASPG